MTSSVMQAMHTFEAQRRKSAKMASANAIAAIENCLEKFQSGELTTSDVKSTVELVQRAGGGGKFAAKYSQDNPVGALTAAVQGHPARAQKILAARQP